LKDVAAPEGSAAMESIVRTEGDLAVLTLGFLPPNCSQSSQTSFTISNTQVIGISCAALRTLYRNASPVSKDLISPTVFDENITSSAVSGLRALVKKAVREKDWKDVISDGMRLSLRWMDKFMTFFIQRCFWTELRADPPSHSTAPVSAPPQKGTSKHFDVAVYLMFLWLLSCQTFLGLGLSLA
jgi:hypothetical protein